MLKTLGVCSWSLHPDGCADLIERVQSCGLSHIQIALDPFDHGKWDLESTAQSLEAAKINLCSGMMTTAGEDYSTLDSIKRTGGVRPDEYWEANLKRARENAKFAYQLGLDLVTFHAGFIPEDGSAEHDAMVDRIKAIADIFGAFEIRTGLETGQEHAQTLLDLLSAPGLSHVGVNFDPANMILYGMDDPAHAIEMLKDHIVQVHMKDAIPTEIPGTWGQEVPAGKGAVDWDHLFQLVQSLPDEINVVIEREAGHQRVEDIIEAREIAIKHGCGQ